LGGPPVAYSAVSFAGEQVPGFDPLEPFENGQLLRDVLDALARFEYKLYGPIPDSTGVNQRSTSSTSTSVSYTSRSRIAAV